MSDPRRIAVVTSSRADYGLLRSLLRGIAADDDLVLQLVATGTHLSPEFGMTCTEIEADGFGIDARVEMLLSADSPLATAKSMGLGVLGFADAFARLVPDVAVVLGDRYEILAAAETALVMRIPIAHIHGGELSEGAFDDSIRHAVTKMAQWHFVAAAPYRERVIQMGESPDRVFDVGAPGLDELSAIAWLDRAALAETLGLALEPPVLLVTYHPVTLGDEEPTRPTDELLAALESIPGATIVFTYPNADTGGRAVLQRIERFVAASPDRRRVFASLGRRRYLSLMRQADVVVGNSSSGVIEAPALERATVDIGDRQKGRLKASSVIPAAERREDITRAIELALSDGFRQELPGTVSLYGKGDAAQQILERLRIAPLTLTKKFFDIARRDQEHGLT